MRDYVLLTDSCCDLSVEMAAELGVEILPLSLEMGGKSYRNYPDGRDIGFQEFYTRLRAGELATTSAVNVGEFEDKMRALLQTGRDILCLSFPPPSPPPTSPPSLQRRSCEANFPMRALKRWTPSAPPWGRDFWYTSAPWKSRRAAVWTR